VANIVINEISQNYTYAIGNNAYATIALPITACWGPGYVDPATLSGIQTLASETDADLADVAWSRFSSNQAGMEQFIATYRGPAANYRLANDYSYQMALTLLSVGYDVLVCRLAPGAKADGVFQIGDQGSLAVKAKYPGTFGNTLRCYLSQKPLGTSHYWNLIIRVEDPLTGVSNAVENLSFTFNVPEVETNIPLVSEVESKFVDLTVSGSISDDDTYAPASGSDKLSLIGGEDWPATPEAADISNAVSALLTSRYGSNSTAKYVTKVNAKVTELKAAYATNESKLAKIYYTEWVYTAAYRVYDLLKDKLSYNPQRIISPGWDDQDLFEYEDPSEETSAVSPLEVSPLHKKIMEVAYYSRCGAGMLDAPRSCPPVWFYNEETAEGGYVQQLSKFQAAGGNDVNGILFNTNSGILFNWAYFTLVTMTKAVHMPPSFLSLIISRAQILNQAAQYEWLIPSNKKHNVKITKFDYTITKSILDKWQKQEGVGVNILTPIPDIGTVIWGNSTLFDLPPATYQALANMSTRYLVNAVKDIAYRCGIAITFQYNNSQAYDKFYAGCAPLLDTMKNQGAILDWYIKMSADINAEDQVAANTVIGKIYLVVPGVINDIYIDLIALPPTVSLDQFIS